MKTRYYLVEYWDPKVDRVFCGPYLRKHWYLNGKRIGMSVKVDLDD